MLRALALADRCLPAAAGSGQRAGHRRSRAGRQRFGSRQSRGPRRRRRRQAARAGGGQGPRRSAASWPPNGKPPPPRLPLPKRGSAPPTRNSTWPRRWSPSAPSGLASARRRRWHPCWPESSAWGAGRRCWGSPIPPRSTNSSASAPCSIRRCRSSARAARRSRPNWRKAAACRSRQPRRAAGSPMRERSWQPAGSTLLRSKPRPSTAPMRWAPVRLAPATVLVASSETEAKVLSAGRATPRRIPAGGRAARSLPPRSSPADRNQAASHRPFAYVLPVAAPSSEGVGAVSRDGYPLAWLDAGRLSRR